MPRLLAAFPAVAGLQQIVDRIGGGVDVYSAFDDTFRRTACASDLARPAMSFIEDRVQRSVTLSSVVAKSSFRWFSTCSAVS